MLITTSKVYVHLGTYLDILIFPCLLYQTLFMKPSLSVLKDNCTALQCVI